MNANRAFLEQMIKTLSAVAPSDIDQMAVAIDFVRKSNGRLFILGVGGSAANSSHAVNDFRKLCGIQAYAPTDNVAELTARTNDDGWPSVFASWLKTSHLSAKDAILVLSVGGGNVEHGISLNLVHAVDTANSVGALVLGIVGRDGGYAHANGDHVVVAQVSDPALVTPITESFQSVVLHALVSHPLLAVQKAKWEATAP